jgi:amino acid transporter
MFALLSGVTIVTAMAKYACKCDLVDSIKKNMSWTTDNHHSTLETTFSIALLCIMAFINFMGIETSKVVANTISVVMLAVILGIIVLSLPYIEWNKLAASAPAPSGSSAPNGGGSSTKPWDNFVLSAILSLFLYNGYDFLVKISDESADPENNKTALISTIGITTLLYAGIMIAGILEFAIGIRQPYENIQPFFSDQI